MRRLPTPQRIDLRGSIQDSLQIANDFEEAPERGTFQEAPSEMEAPGTGLPPLAKFVAPPLFPDNTHIWLPRGNHMGFPISPIWCRYGLPMWAPHIFGRHLCMVTTWAAHVGTIWAAHVSTIWAAHVGTIWDAHVGTIGATHVGTMWAAHAGTTYRRIFLNPTSRFFSKFGVAGVVWRAVGGWLRAMTSDVAAVEQTEIMLLMCRRIGT